MLETLAKVFFRVCESKILFRENFAKIGYYNYYVKGCDPLPPGIRQEKDTRECEWSSSQVSKSEALREPNAKAPGLRFSFSAPPADGRGLWIGIFSRKSRESYTKERAKVNVYVEGGGPNFVKKNTSWKGILWY